MSSSLVVKDYTRNSIIVRLTSEEELMSYRLLLRKSFFIFSMIFFVLGSVTTGHAQTAKDIVKRSDDLMRGLQSYAKVTMKIKRPEWSREVIMETWSEGTEKAFIRTLAPAKEKGVTFLKIGREAWNYLPSAERVIKIPPSMMLQSWMGSDFTNDDLVKADSLVVDYTHKIEKDYEENGIKFWQLLLVPKENAAVVWGKVVLKVRQDNYVTTKCEYFNEDMKLVKYFETSNIQKVEGKFVPMEFTMKNLKKSGYSTTIIYDELTFKPKIGPDTFSKSNLKRKGG